jgi:hypothetical protein
VVVVAVEPAPKNTTTAVYLRCDVRARDSAAHRFGTRLRLFQVGVRLKIVGAAGFTPSGSYNISDKLGRLLEDTVARILFAQGN